MTKWIVIKPNKKEKRKKKTKEMSKNAIKNFETLLTMPLFLIKGTKQLTLWLVTLVGQPFYRVM
jgi:hypothetical protein